jgi:penicillin amidase
MSDPQIDAAGFSFPSSPGIIIGHNAAIGWGLSIGKGVDQWDTYHVAPNPERPLEQYKWNGEWANFSTREETFKIVEQSDVTISVRETVHGPVINDILEEDPDGFHMEQSGNPIALQWTCLEPGGMGVALRRLIVARDWDDFRAALSYWDSPPCNFSYADVSGNIGYQLAAKIPLRAKDDSGLVPRDGTTEATIWKGFLPFEYAPRSFNPEDGLIVNANQAAASEEYFDWLSEQLGADFNAWFQPTAYCGYRAERVRRLLEGAAPYSLEYFASMQSDAKLPDLEEVTPYLASLKIDDAPLSELRDWLLEWDGVFSTDSSRATFYSLFWTHLLRDVYKDEAPVPRPNDAGMYAVNQLLQDPANAWWDDVETSDVVEERDAILVRALSEAAAHAKSSLGSDRDAWRWGEVHTIKFINLSLGSTSLEMMTSYVNRGPYPFPGGMETVNLGEWTADTASFGVVWASCVRMILDVGNWDDSLASLAPGQSGHPASANYADQVDDWRKVEHHKMAWRRDSVLKATKNRLYIEPK